MAYRQSKWSTIPYLFFITFITFTTPKLCHCRLEQVDPSISDVEGMDYFPDKEEVTYSSSPTPKSTEIETLGPGTDQLEADPTADDSNINAVIEFKISTTTEETPMIYFPGALTYDQPCSVYGDDIDLVQKSFISLNEKNKRLKGSDTLQFFGSKVCNWSKYRLECIPDAPRPPVTVPPDPSKPNSGRLKGKCKCLRGLGEAAFWHDRDGVTKCVIPANKGLGSNCDHDVFLPYGEIDEGHKVRKLVASAALMCVPNAECDIGYLYTGKRCKCKKGTKARSNGMCQDGHRFSVNYILVHTVTVIAFLGIFR